MKIITAYIRTSRPPSPWLLALNSVYAFSRMGRPLSIMSRSRMPRSAGCITPGISQKNYPQIKQKGNVLEGDFTQYKGFDLLIGGSPCTYWSIAKRGRETTCLPFRRKYRQTGIILSFSFLQNQSGRSDFGMLDHRRCQLPRAGVSVLRLRGPLPGQEQKKRLLRNHHPGQAQGQRGFLMSASVRPSSEDRSIYKTGNQPTSYNPKSLRSRMRNRFVFLAMVRAPSRASGPSSCWTPILNAATQTGSSATCWQRSGGSGPPMGAAIRSWARR